MHKQKIKAFTLVELIVVITILAILGTIAFISLSWYSTSARDSTRISDISSMKSSLELYELDAGNYPLATNGVNITYSGTIVWNQWTFWETVKSITSKLNKIPTDPLTDKEYTYSTISTRNEYEIWAMMEWDDISYISNQNTVNAALSEALAYTSWNYNSVMTKTLSGSNCTVFSLPTILTNDTSVTDLQQIVTEKRFVYAWYKNLPWSLKWSKFNHEWWFDFQPQKLVAYSDTGSCNTLINDTTASWTTARVNLLKNLQDSYSGSVIQNDGEINNIVKKVIDVNNPSTDVNNYVWDLVNNNFKWWH